LAKLRRADFKSDLSEKRALSLAPPENVMKIKSKS
jgi:hypothetical protein